MNVKIPGEWNSPVIDKNKYNLMEPASERIETEALAWIAQMSSDEFTAKDLAAFREWVRRSPAHEKEVKAIAKLWGEMNVLTELMSPISEADRVAKALRRKDKNRKSFDYRVAFASIAIFATLTVAAIMLSPQITKDSQAIRVAEVNVPIVFKSVVGEQQKHTLPDGSIITLNTNSHIDVDFSDNQRTVRLLKGEALFSVAKDPNKPFVVVADNGIVRAVGTEFSVRLQNKSIDVVVSEGSVELATLEPTLPSLSSKLNLKREVTKIASLGIITAGQTAKIANSEAKVELHAVAEIDAKLAWKSGRLEFLGKPLDEVVSEVGRYTNLEIIIDDPEIKKLSFGGAFNVGETDVLFRTLDSQYGISAEFSDDKQTVRLVRN